MAAMSPVNGERKDCIDTILAGISRLNKEVIDAGDYIPAYDQRAYSQVSVCSSPSQPSNSFLRSSIARAAVLT